ncbi:hypothetical protein H0H87_012118 [Tephrocybe sp. NHM501043]|nr:hypothetical protein H0H87_012118 [Tephrocybe sp. NHM501043]
MNQRRMADTWENDVAEMYGSVWRAQPYSNLVQVEDLLRSTDKSNHPNLLRNRMSEAEFKEVWRIYKQLPVDRDLGYLCEAFAIQVADGILKTYPRANPLFRHTGNGQKRLGHGFIVMRKPAAADDDPYQLVDSSVSAVMPLPVGAYLWQTAPGEPFTQHTTLPNGTNHKISAVIYRSKDKVDDILYWDRTIKLTHENDSKRTTEKLDRAQMVARTRHHAFGSTGRGPGSLILLVHEKTPGRNTVAVSLICYPSTGTISVKTFAEGIRTSEKVWNPGNSVTGNGENIRDYLEQTFLSEHVTVKERSMMRIIIENFLKSF